MVEFVGTLQGNVLVGGSDRSLHVMFHTVAKQNHFASKEAGRPIFDEVEYVQIMIPGDKHTIIDCKATDEFKQRFPEQYARFKSQHTEQLVGTPLEEVPWLTKVQVAELKGLHVHTLENLAGMQDGLITKAGMGMRALVAKANAFLQSAMDSALVTKQQDQLSKQEADIERQQGEIATLTAQLAELSAKFATPEQKTRKVG